MDLLHGVGTQAQWGPRRTYRLWLMLEGEHHGLRESSHFGVLHDDPQDLLAQDLAGILVLDIWVWGERGVGWGGVQGWETSPNALLWELSLPRSQF